MPVLHVTTQASCCGTRAKAWMRRTQALIAAARAFGHDSQPLTTALVAHGFPPTFLNDLVAAISGYEAAIGARAANIGARMAARAGVKTAFRAALSAVLRLDAIVPNQLRDDPETYATWENARHVERLPRARNGGRKPSPVPAPTAGPVTMQAG